MKTCTMCNQEYEALRSTSKYCSPKCRVTASRAVSVTEPSVTDTVTPLSVTPHAEPINWADPDKDYSTIARKTDGLITVPGDPGYKGVCVQEDGQWIVRPEPEPTGIKHVLKPIDLKDWRGSRPYYLNQDTGLSHLADEQLHRRLNDLNQWQGSPEYAERVYRLTNGLTAYCLPANMVTA